MPKKILIIDDDVDLVEVLRLTWKKTASASSTLKMAPAAIS